MKKLLVQIHLWLGLGLSLFLLLWFVSGVVMMYAGYPGEVGQGERLERMAPLELERLRIDPDHAIRAGGVGSVQSLRMEMLLGAPVYRLPRPGGGLVTVRADTGERLEPLSLEQAAALAVEFAGEGTASLDRTLQRPDVWTLAGGHRPGFPMYRFRIDDPSATLVHISPGNADVANSSTRPERILALAGAVLHYLYLPPLRRDASLWRWVVVALSGLGTALCLSGLVLGLIYLRPAGLRSRQPGLAWSPFVGAMKWHHYLGLAFGFVTFTWVLSGMLSLNPGYSPSSAPAATDHAAIAGGPLLPDAFRLPVTAAVAAVAGELTVKQVEWIRFRNVPYYLLREAPNRTRLVRADQETAPPAIERLPMDALSEAARAAFIGIPVRRETVLDEYDLYYYSRVRAYERGPQRRLPVLRVEFADAEGTWAYLEPYTGRMVARFDRVGRAHRWAFNFLHSFDLPLLLRNRPLWDALVLLLLAGGTALTATGVWIGGRWITRQVAR